MRDYTLERARLNRRLKPQRDAFLDLFRECWYCGAWDQLCVNEMVCGTGGRVQGIQHRLAWSCACWRCNSNDCQDYEKWPIVLQLALKHHHDPEHMNLEVHLPIFNKLRRRAPGAITKGEVVLAYCRWFDVERRAA